MSDDLINCLCCLGTATQVAEAAAQEPAKKEPIATPVFGCAQLPMIALTMDRKVTVESVSVEEEPVNI